MNIGKIAAIVKIGIVKTEYRKISDFSFKYRKMKYRKDFHKLAKYRKNLIIVDMHRTFTPNPKLVSAIRKSCV